MALSKIPTGTLIAEMANATQQVEIYLPSITGIQFFLSLLDLVNKGVKVEMILPENAQQKLDLKDSYFQNLVANGGQVYFLNSSAFQSLPQGLASRFFAVIDHDRVLYDSAVGRNGLIHFQDAKRVKQFQLGFYQLRGFSSIPYGNVSRTFEQPPSSSIVPLQATAASSKSFRKIKIHLSCDQAEVEPDMRFALEWNVENAERVRINQGIGEVSNRGMKYLSVRQTTEFLLTAENQMEQISRIITVRVSDKPRIHYSLSTQDPQTGEEVRLTFREDLPDRFAIIEGQVLRLDWQAFNSETLHWDGVGDITLQGSKTLVPEKLTSIHFEAVGSKGTISRTIVINVFPIPQITELFTAKAPNVEVSTKVDLIEPQLSQLLENTDNLNTLITSQKPSKSETPEQDRQGGVWDRLKRLFSS